MNGIWSWYFIDIHILTNSCTVSDWTQPVTRQRLDEIIACSAWRHCRHPFPFKRRYEIRHSQPCDRHCLISPSDSVLSLIGIKHVLFSSDITVRWWSQGLSVLIATDRIWHCRSTVPDSGSKPLIWLLTPYFTTLFVAVFWRAFPGRRLLFHSMSNTSSIIRLR